MMKVSEKEASGTAMFDKYNNLIPEPLQKELIEDVELQKLHAEKVKIYSIATPTIILKYGKAERILIDHQLIKKINELIEFRTHQIIDAYSNRR